MTYAEIVGRVQAIQSQLAQLAPPRPSGVSAAGFASALAGASTVDGSVPAGVDPGVTGDDVVQAALAYKDVPYVLGGTTRSGIDCSGLVQAAFEDLGVDVPRLVSQQKSIGQEVGSLADAKPGDLIVLNGDDHIAIWMGNGTAIHAPYPGRTVSVQKAWFDDADVTTIRRVVPSSDTETSGAGGALSPATVARASALLGMTGAGAADGGSPSLDTMLSSLGLGGTSSTSQQLVAARSALLGSGV